MMSSKLRLASDTVFKRLGPPTNWSYLQHVRHISTCRVAQSVRKTPAPAYKLGLMPQSIFRSFERRLDKVPKDFDLIYRTDKITMLGMMQVFQPMLFVSGVYTLFSPAIQTDDLSFLASNVSQAEMLGVGMYVIAISSLIQLCLRTLVLRIYYNEDEDLFMMIHYSPFIPLKSKRLLLQPSCLKQLPNEGALAWLTGTHEILPKGKKVTLNRELFRSPHLYTLMLGDFGDDNS